LVTKSRSALYRFFSRAKWAPDELARLLVVHVIVPLLAADAEILVAADDTTSSKHGRRVAFAGWYRDASRSNVGQANAHWAHNWVIVCLLLPCPFRPGRLLHLPLLARLFVKEKDCSREVAYRGRGELVAEMIGLLASWVGPRRIRLTADGAYASRELLERLPVTVTVISRVRANATLFDLFRAPAVRRRGRPRQKGAPLPKVGLLSKRLRFRRATVDVYGHPRRVLLATRLVVWWRVSRKPVRLVIVRDGRHDDFFFSTDIEMEPSHLVETYAARWGVEECIRETKQSLGFDQVQSWTPKAALRQAPFVLVMHSVVQAAWWRTDATHAPASFGRLLTELRVGIWRQRINATPTAPVTESKIMQLLELSLATAA
jgi:hypothetical protein